MHSPVNELLGVIAEDLPGGGVRLSLVTDARHENEVGLVHGGLIAFLLDGAMGRAVGRTLEPGALCSTVQLSIQYLERGEGRLSAESRILRRGRAVCFVEAECRSEDGRVVARAHGTWALRPPAKRA